MSDSKPTTVSFQTEEVQVTRRSYEIELSPEQADQFEALRDDPEAQQVYLMSAVEEGTAVMHEEQVTEQTQEVTQVKMDHEDEPRRLPAEKLRSAGKTIQDSATVEYAHTVVFNEADAELGAVRSEEQVFAQNYGQALRKFMSEMEAENREVLRVFPPPLPDAEIPRWLDLDNGVAHLVPIEGEEGSFAINQWSTVEVGMPPNPDEPIRVGVRCGDEIIQTVEITPEMLAAAQQADQSPGARPGL